MCNKYHSMSAISDGKAHKFLPFSMSITRKNYAINSQRDNMSEAAASSASDGRMGWMFCFCKQKPNKLASHNWQSCIKLYSRSWQYRLTERERALSEEKNNTTKRRFILRRRMRDAKEDDVNKIHINQVCVWMYFAVRFFLVLFFLFISSVERIRWGIDLSVWVADKLKNLLFHCSSVKYFNFWIIISNGFHTASDFAPLSNINRRMFSLAGSTVSLLFSLNPSP